MARQASDVDTEQFSLSRLLDKLQEADELESISAPTELADIAQTLHSNAKAVLFEQAGPERVMLVGNVTASRQRLALAFGVRVHELLPEILSRLKRRPEIIEVERHDARVQDVVVSGNDVDVTVLPVHLQHDLDGAPYISSSVDIVVDPSTGLSNVGMRRLMLRGKRETGIDLQAPSDLRAIYEAQSRLGRHLPIAFAVGSHPIDHVAACMRMPGDEIGIISQLRGAPLPVVKCITNDLKVPADAEYILEGYLDARGVKESEGPYGEFLGYYGPVKQNPVFRLTAITHRRNPIFQTSTIAGRDLANTDTAQLAALRTEVTIWKALETAVREPVAVHASTSSGGMLNARIALRQRAPGEARNAIAAAFGSVANVKHVFVVDPDIDVFSSDQVDWALATRFQADRDLIVATGLRALPLDPSLQGARTGAKAGFDCTLPFGSPSAEVPEPPLYEGQRFATLEDALKAGSKTFAELMAALRSRDGREIVRALESLRISGQVSRDGEGRWQMKA